MADASIGNLAFHLLTEERWPDFERLFGERGACGGCWCMYWRLPHAAFQRRKGDGNRKAMREIVASGAAPGILAYAGDTAVGWCAVAPRPDFPRLARSRILKPVDAAPVWSVVCFFVDRKHRHQGLSVKLLEAAVACVRDRGGKILEGYPVEPKNASVPAVFAYTGLAAAFEKAGFVECARRSETRPIMRFYIPA